MADGPCPCYRIEHEPFAINGFQACSFQKFVKLIRCDEFLPFMCAFGQPTHDVFGPDDCHHIAFGISVKGRANHDPTGFQQPLAGIDIRLRIGHMLDDFHVQNGVELFTCI